LRSDDDPEVLKRRIEAYREQTAPLVDYYRWQGALKSVDGMAPIPAVARAIDLALDPSPAESPAKQDPTRRSKTSGVGSTKKKRGTETKVSAKGKSRASDARKGAKVKAKPVSAKRSSKARAPKRKVTKPARDRRAKTKKSARTGR
jgi:adenylate kinase